MPKIDHGPGLAHFVKRSPIPGEPGGDDLTRFPGVVDESGLSPRQQISQAVDLIKKTHALQSSVSKSLEELAQPARQGSVEGIRAFLSAVEKEIRSGAITPELADYVLRDCNLALSTLYVGDRRQNLELRAAIGRLMGKLAEVISPSEGIPADGVHGRASPSVSAT